MSTSDVEISCTHHIIILTLFLRIPTSGTLTHSLLSNQEVLNLFAFSPLLRIILLLTSTMMAVRLCSQAIMQSIAIGPRLSTP